MDSLFVHRPMDRAKVGRIVANYIKACGIPRVIIAKKAGMSEDMLSNVCRGLNKEISLERIFDICFICGHTVNELILDYIADEDIPYREEFDALYMPSSVNLTDDAVNFVENAVSRGIAVREMAVALRETEVVSTPVLSKTLDPEVFALLRADRAEQAERTKAAHDASMAQVVEQFKGQIQQLIEQNKATITYCKEREQMLIREHDQHVADIKAAHIEAVDHLQQEREREIGYLKAENVRQRKWIVRLGVMLGIETSAVVGVFMYDALNHSVGWFRGFLKHFSNAPFDALKS